MQPAPSNRKFYLDFPPEIAEKQNAARRRRPALFALKRHFTPPTK
jgi:hypothetical protein